MSGGTQLYLVVETGDSEAASAALTTVLGAGRRVPCVLIRPPAGGVLEPRSTKRLIEQAQAGNAAALIADNAELARTLRADGVHLSWSKTQNERFAEARSILGQRTIIGADAGRSRHDAMTLGEAGADYVAFGIPAHVEDRATARERQRDLIEWWSELFEIPCVALDVETREDAQRLAQANADFVALAVPQRASAQEVLERFSDFAAAINDAEVSA